VTWSPEMHRIYATDATTFEPSFEGFLSRVVPEERDATRAVIANAYAHPAPFVHYHRVQRPDGSIRMLHTRGDVIVGADGRPERLLGVCWDTTDHWQASLALERTTSLVRATLDATADGVLVVDAAGQSITTYNERFIELWNVPRELVAARDDAALLAYVAEQLEDPTQFARGVQELYDHPEREAFDVLRFRDGRVFERFSRPQRVGNTIAGRVWSFRDVTEREQLLRRAVFLSDTARLLSSIDIDEALRSVAQLAVPYLGETCAIDLVGEGAPRRVFATSGVSTEPDLSPQVLGGRSLIYSTRATNHLGVPLIVRGNVSGAITFAAPPGRKYTRRDLDVVEDLARRMSLALEIATLLERANDALRARDEFLAIAAHEIRGPITSMQAAVQLLMRGKLSDDVAKRALELILREQRRLTRFVDELLDLGLTRTDATFDVEQVRLARVVRDVVSRSEDAIKHSGSRIVTELDEHASGRWNRDRLERLVEALLSNALKFGLGKAIDIRVFTRDGHVLLSIRDRGIGIAPDARDRIFAPFERAVSVRHYGGLGLGLHIASSIVASLGGTISVESEPNAGSTFTVDLPRAPG
jgi:signal transduction histidine kinase/PAS domain-containing protein